MKKLILATKNSGKVREVKAILECMPFEVVCLADIEKNIEIIEDGTTFEENAVKKARAVAEATGEPALADDSGIEIDYLDKAPGVYSARYLGEDTPYAVKNAKVLEIMKNVPEEKRGARFVSVIAAVFPDGKTLTSRGTIEGIIGYEIRGENGFGYDPILFLPQYGQSMGEISMELKNKISHRGKALEKMKELLKNEI